MLQQLRRNGEVALSVIGALVFGYVGVVEGKSLSWFLLCFNVLVLAALLFQTREELVALRDDVNGSE